MLLTGISTADVLLALLTLQQQFTAIKMILSDAGSQLALDIKGFEPRSQSERQLLIALTRAMNKESKFKLCGEEDP